MLLPTFIYAQKATGSCNLPGSSSYVKVGYYDDGHLAVSNQSSIPLAEIHVRVICTASWKERQDGTDSRTGNPISRWVDKSKEITLCDQDYYNIPTLQTISITDGVQKPNVGINGATYSNFRVSVGNLICKKEE